MSTEYSVTKTILGIQVKKVEVDNNKSCVVGRGIIFGQGGVGDIRAEVMVDPKEDKPVKAAIKIRLGNADPFHVIDQGVAKYGNDGEAVIFLSSWLYTYKVVVPK